MFFAPLSDLEPSLRVDVISLIGAKVDISTAIWLLPVGGRIESLVYKDVVRGRRRKKEGKCFRHNLAITVRSPLSGRRAVVRLNRMAHVTGLSKSEDVEASVNHLLGELMRVSSEWEDAKRGEDPDFCSRNMGDMPEETRCRVKDVLMSEGKRLLSFPDISIDNITQAMENYTFRLKAPINIRRFPYVCREEGFICGDSGLSKGKIIVKKESAVSGRNVTFTVSSSGTATLSGPCAEEITPIYDSFVKMCLLREGDIYVDCPFSVRIYPRSSGSSRRDVKFNMQKCRIYEEGIVG